MSAFRSRVATLGEDGLARELGPQWGLRARRVGSAALVLDALDEVSHRGAEVVFLRDLYLRRDALSGADG